MEFDKFYIYTCEPFPYGFAGTNRLIAYAKGFLHHGKDVEIVCFRKTEQPGKVMNKDISGVYQGIGFKYLTHTTIRSGSFVKRRIDNFIIHLKLFEHAIKYVNRKTVIIYYAASTSHLLLLKIVAAIKGAKIYKEDSEHPHVYARNKSLIPRLVFMHLHYRLFDGLFLMTKSLVNYFSNIKKITKPILHVPMTVEVDRFTRIPEEKGNSKEIVYTGMLDDKKDGTDILIKAFSRISPAHPEYSLSLYGEASSPADTKRYVEMAEELKVRDKVRFHGRVSRDLITQRIVNAAILVLPRPDSIQAQNGFPTKLGEYLATGIPVIATAVGEIPDYLRDNESVFMAIPGDTDSLVEKFSSIIADYQKALKVAEQGRRVAHQNFNNIVQTRNIISFVEKDIK